MKKSVIIGVGVIVIVIILFLFFIFKTKNNLENGSIYEKIFSGSGLEGLCNEKECNDFCETNAFACEAYCIQHPENAFCKERFSFVYNIDESSEYIGHPLFKFTEFRNYNYTFKNGELQEQEPIIKHIGVEIDFYDAEKNRAGDFVFNKFTHPWNTKIFYDYGEIIGNSDGTTKQLPEATYIVPLGTKVHAMTDGVITGIRKQDTGDYEINLVRPESPLWTFGYDHVINPAIKEGDRVISGQVIGEVSDYNQWFRGDGYGAVEIVLARTQTSFIAHCPFAYLDESVRQDYLDKIKALYISWENYTKNSSLYNENNYSIPGCLVSKPFESK